MSKKERTSRTSKTQIANYWSEIMPISECELNFDWGDAHNVCWNCGDFNKNTEKCHIIPFMLGGKDIPENYVLLCHSCHEEAPDVLDKNKMWTWIKSNRTSTGRIGSYHLEKILREFERCYGYPFIKEACKIEDSLIKLGEYYAENSNKVGTHAGKIKISTMASFYKGFIEKYK